MQKLNDLKDFIVALKKKYSYEEYSEDILKINKLGVFENIFFIHHDEGHKDIGFCNHLKITFKAKPSLSEFMNFLKASSAEYVVNNFNRNNTLDWWLDDEGEYDLAFNWPQNTYVKGIIHNIPYSPDSQIESLFLENKFLIQSITIDFHTF